MLCSEYPSVMIPASLKSEIKSLANNKSNPASAGLLFRMLICTLVEDDKIWAENRAKIFLKKYANEVAPSQSDLFKHFLK